MNGANSATGLSAARRGSDEAFLISGHLRNVERVVQPTFL